MFAVRGCFLPACVALAIFLSQTATFVSCENAVLAKRGPSDYWSMATVAANALSPITALVNPADQQPLEPLYNNPAFAPLFQELPKLMGELKELTPEKQMDVLFLFKIYSSLPGTITPFFHQSISQMTQVGPALADLTKFNIASELSTYVQSIADPIPNTFTKIADYVPKIQRRAPFPMPSLSTIMGVVGEVVMKNLGLPLPMILFNILREVLTMLIKAYLQGMIPGLPSFSLPKIPNLLPNLPNPLNVARNPVKRLRRPRFRGKRPN